ncbi:MAG: hypothetical protein ACI9DC_001964 [Gammaproteobacteria bacterium]|jgi:hypothetical protein
MDPGLFTTGSLTMSRLFLALLFLGGLANAAEIHKWVDRNGKTHFGDRPPADGTPSREVHLRDIPKSDLRVPSNEKRRARQDYLLRSYNEERTKKLQSVARENTRRDQLAEKCDRANKKLQKFKQSSYLYEVDAAGKKAIHSNEARDQAIQTLEKAITKSCR